MLYRWIFYLLPIIIIINLYRIKNLAIDPLSSLQKKLMNFKSATYQSRRPETSSSADASYDVQSVLKENLHHLRSSPDQLLKPYNSCDTPGNILWLLIAMESEKDSGGLLLWLRGG